MKAALKIGSEILCPEGAVLTNAPNFYMMIQDVILEII